MGQRRVERGGGKEAEEGKGKERREKKEVEKPRNHNTQNISVAPPAAPATALNASRIFPHLIITVTPSGRDSTSIPWADKLRYRVLR